MRPVMEADPMFFPGREVTIQTSDSRILTFIIDKPFAPFTKAVVLLARCPELGPDPVVVKIYDPRFLDERLVGPPYYPPRLWSLEAEQAVDAIWDEPFDYFEFRRRDEPTDAAGHAALAALWEKHYRLLSTGCFADERAVYERLRPLQGTAIPRLLLTGTILPPDERAFQPPVVVIEYVPDAISLGDVPADAVTPELCAALLRTVDSFAAYGVVHTDVNWTNILFTPRERPTCVVVIDFGCGAVREEEGQGDEDWEEVMRFAHDSSQMRWVLKQRGISVPDG